MLTVTYQMIRDATKAAKDEADKLQNQPLMSAILELQGLAFELQGQNAELKGENERLASDRELKSSISFREGVYWSDRPANPGPFCPLCYGDNAKLVPLAQINPGLRYCHIHTASFDVPGVDEPEPDPEPRPRRSLLDRQY